MKRFVGVTLFLFTLANIAMAATGDPCVAAKKLAMEVDDYMQDWRGQLHDVSLGYDEQMSHSPLEEQRALEAEKVAQLANVNHLHDAKRKDLFVRTEQMRVALIKQALTKKRPFHTITRITVSDLDAASKRLATSGPSDAFDRDPQTVSAYLLELCK